MRQLAFVCLLAILTSVTCLPQDDAWRTLMNEGAVAENAGDYAKAAVAYRDATALVETLDPASPRRAATWNSLATAYSWLSKFVDSESAYRRALREAERAGGKKGDAYAFVLANLGSLFVETGRLAAGEKLLRESLAIQTGAVERDELRVALAQNSLAEILCQKGKYREAETFILPALSVLDARQSEATETALARNNLGVIRFFQKRYGEADRLITQALAGIEKRVGPDHPLLAQILNNLASVEARTGRPHDAGQHLSRGLAILEHNLGTDHPLYGSLLANYARYLRETGDKSQAKAFLARSNQILTDSRRRNGTGSIIDVSSLQRR